MGVAAFAHRRTDAWILSCRSNRHAVQRYVDSRDGIRCRDRWADKNADFAGVPRTLWLALAALGFLGLAMLAKGPAALILSGGGVLLWAAITKRWATPCCLHPVAVATFLATGLPWYVLCAP